MKSLGILIDLYNFDTQNLFVIWLIVGQNQQGLPFEIQICLMRINGGSNSEILSLDSANSMGIQLFTSYSFYFPCCVIFPLLGLYVNSALIFCSGLH